MTKNTYYYRICDEDVVSNLLELLCGEAPS